MLRKLLFFIVRNKGIKLLRALPKMDSRPPPLSLPFACFLRSFSALWTKKAHCISNFANASFSGDLPYVAVGRALLYKQASP